MLAEAIKAKIPIIGTRTDDLLNVHLALQSIAGKKAYAYSGLQKAEFAEGIIYYTLNGESQLTVALYRALLNAQTSLVVVNPKEVNSLLFDAGEMPVPPEFIKNYLKDFADPEELPKLMKALAGLTLKSASEVMQLTMASTGMATAEAVKKTRSRLRMDVDGLIAEDTSLPFYVMPKKLREWVDENRQFFLEDGWPQDVVPRGLLFDGPPGTGKTMAPRAICQEWGIPLYRLKISGLLNKFIGVSENRLDKFLQTIDAEAPCGLLIDEAEKLFRGDSEGTTNRQLAMLLWWQQEHKSRVMTFATTNKFTAIPPEFYRPGRFDEIIKMRHLAPSEAQKFGLLFLGHLIKEEPSSIQEEVIAAALLGEENFTQAMVSEKVVSVAKKMKWIKKIS